MIKSSIKNMNLYKSTSRFIRNYNQLSASLNRKPTIEEIASIDQLHYNGTKAVEEAIIKTNINSQSLVLDIGSGIGGPARYIAHKTKSYLYALEIQKELNDIASKLTFDYKLNKNINHIEADILEYNFKDVKFDIIVSWLALYHIPKRKKLLEKLFKLLKSNGIIYSEDFYLKRKLTSTEKNTLSKSFFANHLVSYNKYKNELINNNFKVVEFTDMTNNWMLFTKKRLNEYKKNIDLHIKVHDEETVNYILSFYELAFKLLSENILGGIKYICKK